MSGPKTVPVNTTMFMECPVATCTYSQALGWMASAVERAIAAGTIDLETLIGGLYADNCLFPN